MGSLKEEAKKYEPATTKNITELPRVALDCAIEEREYVDSSGNSFQIKVINVDGVEYRVPNSVLKSLKAIINEKPNLKFVKVIKQGEGLKTEYTTIPLE